MANRDSGQLPHLLKAISPYFFILHDKPYRSKVLVTF